MSIFKAFEHLLERELISLMDNNRRGALSIEYRPVKLLVSSHELHQGLKLYHSCPVSFLLISIIMLQCFPSFHNTEPKPNTLYSLMLVSMDDRIFTEIVVLSVGHT